jgi:hypothetical protein
VLLNGILYFHRISDHRIVDRPIENLRMFEKLCGKNAIHNVILTTTMWDVVDEETGRDREEELKSKYWQTMLERKSSTSRFLGTRESALRVIAPLIDAANAKSWFLLQQEMVDMRTKLREKSAGLNLCQETEVLLQQRQQVLERIRKAPNKDKTPLQASRKEYQELMVQLDEAVKKMRKLKLPIGKRLSLMVRKWSCSKSK